MSACPELTSLDISDLFLEGYGDDPVPLKDMKHPLRLMHLANYRGLTDGAFIAAISKHSPALTSLSIRSCTWYPLADSHPSPRTLTYVSQDPRNGIDGNRKL